MIIAEQKTLDELKSLIGSAEKVLVVGCGTCVTVCFAGGAREAAITSSSLRMATKLEHQEKVIRDVTVQRQCEWEYLDQIADEVNAADVVLSLGCGIGVQAIAEHFPNTWVVPGLNTSFLGLPTEQGVWEERCAACGDCILGLTGGICPIARCSKSLLNGPCGGSEAGHCEIDPEVPCAWQLIYDRLSSMGKLNVILDLQPPKNWKASRDGGPRKITTRRPSPGRGGGIEMAVEANKNGYLVGSNLERVLRAGHFAVTGELGPPQSADSTVIREKAGLLKGYCDAVNITDNQTAIVRMSSIGSGAIVVDEGLEPIIQMTARDRNRLAIQSDLLGAYALGMRNLLCLTGDHQNFGNHPTAKNVFDIDSLQMVRMVSSMRDEAIFQSGDSFKGPEPRFFVGAAAAPFADPIEFRPFRLAKKVQAGANFIQTQLVYDIDAFAAYMEKVRDLGVHEQTFILAGVGPLKSPGMARYMKNNVPGILVPDELINRMTAAGGPWAEIKKEDLTKENKRARAAAWQQEGIKICIELIQQLQKIKGVAGVHIMAIEWEEAVKPIVEGASLMPRPVVELPASQENVHGS